MLVKKIGNVTIQANDYLDLINQERKVKNNEYVRQVAEGLINSKCPVCGKPLYLRYWKKFWYFFSHNEKDKAQCPWIEGDYDNKISHSLSPEQLDKAVHHNSNECLECKKEWQEHCNLTFRRDGGKFPYTRKALESDDTLKQKYDVSVEDFLDMFYNEQHINYWGCAHYKDTSHNFKTFTNK